MTEDFDHASSDPAQICEHETWEYRKRFDAWNRPLIAKQCVSCGERLSEDVSPKKFSKGEIAEMNTWDVAMFETFRSKVKIAKNEEIAFQRMIHEELRVDLMRDDYVRYMASPEWHALRKKVFARSGGICEGCGERLAVQVHHLHYRRFRKEMLFDLVAVCLECHEAIHRE